MFSSIGGKGQVLGNSAGSSLFIDKHNSTSGPSHIIKSFTGFDLVNVSLFYFPPKETHLPERTFHQ